MKRYSEGERDKDGQRDRRKKEKGRRKVMREGDKERTDLNASELPMLMNYTKQFISAEYFPKRCI